MANKNEPGPGSDQAPPGGTTGADDLPASAVPVASPATGVSVDSNTDPITIGEGEDAHREVAQAIGATADAFVPFEDGKITSDDLEFAKSVGTWGPATRARARTIVMGAKYRSRGGPL